MIYERETYQCDRCRCVSEDPKAFVDGLCADCYEILRTFQTRLAFDN